jgi:predicted MPP superfamily phosphohydrolase
MGWIFPLESANLVAYLTIAAVVRPPRVRRNDLMMFLGSIGDVYRNRARLISSDTVWIETVQRTASAGLEYLSTLPSRSYDEVLDDETVMKCLASLKPLLSAYDLFALAVGDYTSDRELAAFVDHAAYSSRHHAIFLSPDLPFSNAAFELLDPFPAISLISEQPENWPGMLFWSRTGSACFVGLPDAFDLYERLRRTFERPSPGLEIDELLDAHRSKGRSKRLLQLSDLHFGNADAIEKEAYVSGHLESILKDVDRVVITGDLFNEPKREQAIAFRNFRSSIQRRSGKDPVVIPGNHDQKWLGNFGSPLREMANLEWSSLVFDDDMGCVFYCFDSSRDADWARGKVTKQQMMDVATLFVTHSVSNPAVNEYLPVALVHHHPFSFETGKERLLDRALERVGVTDEFLLRMDDAEAFLAWCAKRGVQLVLHGHKHVYRYVNQMIPIQRGDSQELREISAIGCGTTLGAEGKPLSYNLLSWDPVSRKWSVSFFADPGDGSGFTRQYVALRSMPEPPLA